MVISQLAIEAMAIEIVDLAIEHGDFPLSFTQRVRNRTEPFDHYGIL